MRKPNEDDLSDEAVDTGSVGDGFGGVVDFSESTYYGDSFDDDYTDDEDGGSNEQEADDSFDDADDSGQGVDEQETAFGDEVTEAEAEVVLEDMLDETYGPEAGEVVQSLEESSGMSAVEILEDITGMELGGDREADGSGLDRDGHVDAHDADQATQAFDFDVSD